MFKYKPRMNEMSDTEMDSMILTFLKTELKSYP